MVSIINNGIQSFEQLIQEKVIKRTKSSASGLENVYKKAPLPVRIFFFPISAVIKVSLQLAQWSFLVPYMLWHRLLDDSNQDGFITKGGAPYLSGTGENGGGQYNGNGNGQNGGGPARVQRIWIVRKFDRFLQTESFNNFQATIMPKLSGLLEWPQNELAPFILNIEILKYAVPYVAWKALIEWFGTEEQKLADSSYTNGVAVMLDGVVQQKDALEEERDQLQEQVHTLKRQLSDVQFNQTTNNFSIPSS